MKDLLVILSFVLTIFVLEVTFCAPVHAQDAVSAQAAVAVPQPALAPPIATTVITAPAAVAVAPSAPPSWVVEILATVSGLPVVGPYLSKALLYLGILAAILTTLVGAALSILASLKGAFSWAGFDTAAAAIQSFQSGQIMYWLTYFSNFNAQKPPTV